MSNGYLAAAAADLEAAHEIADGFGLDVIGTETIGDPATAAAALSGAANLGLLLSAAAAHDAAFVSLLRAVAARSQGAQLILVEPEARAAFSFLPETWPAMSLDEARRRSSELRRRREAAANPPPPRDAPAHAAPLPPQAPAEEPAPLQQPEPQPQIQTQEPAPVESAPEPPAAENETPELLGGEDSVEASAPEPSETAESIEEEHPPADVTHEEQTLAAEAPADAAKVDEAPVAAAVEPPPAAMPAPAPPASIAPPQAPRHAPASFGSAVDMHSTTGNAPPRRETAPADATAFAPKKLRRGTPELVRIAIHQPQDLKAVIKAARQADPNTSPAPQSMGIGQIEIGASVGVSLEVRGAECDGAVQRREWRGEPLDFSFAVDADGGVKQVVILARVFVDDAQIGILAFTRPVTGPAKKAASDGDPARLKRFKRVFLSYSSNDRETVAKIATAYQMAGVEHFFDRTSLKSGEEWSPRLRKEIDRSDLFHLCWSKAAASSMWVEKEAEHALTRRRRSNGKLPAITVQMLDGPPWAPHPKHLDAINFDDFVRAAIVGYARGEGSN